MYFGKYFLRYRIKPSDILCLISLLIILLTGCHKSHPQSNSSEVDVTKLKKYETVVSADKGVLADPVLLRYDESHHLFVYDFPSSQVLELGTKGNLMNRYGRGGRGPGEFLHVSNMFLVNHYLYVVDQLQYKISRFKLNGDLEGTLNYGTGNPHAMRPPAPQAVEPRAMDINNQPHVMLNGNVLLPSIQPNSTAKTLYTLVNWKGKPISDIGDVPEGSTFILNYAKYKESIDDQTVPDYYKPQVFAVNDEANTGEFYFIYNAFPKIEKYDASGKELWKTPVLKTPETDSLLSRFYSISAHFRGHDRIGLKTYVAGVSSKSGHLYLGLGKYYFGESPGNGLWIHEFDENGKLLNRYHLTSKDGELVPIFDIDFSDRRIFVVTKMAEIRAYSF